MALDLSNMGVTDEVIAIRATADYQILAPRDQRLAEGEDGVFLSSDRWALASTTWDFAAAGLAPGSMMHLEITVTGLGTGSKATPRKVADQLAVASIGLDPKVAVLRRKGLAAGFGSPPAPVAGATGVKFACLTVQPQVRDAARRIKARFGITSAAQVLVPDDFTNAITCEVLADLYFQQARMAGDEAADNFAAKARSLKTELAMILAGLENQYTDVTQPDSGFTISTPRPDGGWRRPGDGWGGW